MNIRKAIQNDSENISNLVSRLSEKYITSEFSIEGSEALLTSMTSEAINKYIQSGLSYHLAEINRQLVGVVGIRDNSHLYHLFVDEKYHNQGIAKKLWFVASKACLSEGNPGKFTVNSSKFAVPVYENFGFVIKSEPVEKNGVIHIPMQITINS